MRRAARDLMERRERDAAMGMFDGKKGLILGVANDHSIAWAVAEQIMAEGGECGFTHLPDRDERGRNRHRVAQLTDKSPLAKFLVPCDANNDEHLTALAEKTKEVFGTIDFVLHSIAFAKLEDLKVDTIQTSRDGFKLAMETSVFSFLASANALKGLLNPGGSVLTMTYFGGEKAVPGYNVMGICKAALDASVRYLAYDLGPQKVRVNAISAGPLRTMAGRAAGVDAMLLLYDGVAPLGNVNHEDVGKAAAFLLSGTSLGITGEILHVDGGYHAMGSAGRALEKLKAAT